MASKRFFDVVRKRREPGLLLKFMRELDSGLYETPKSFNVLAGYRTEELKLQKGISLMRLSFPESDLIREFYKKYPEAKEQPVVLNSFKMPLAKQFALHQLKLMQQDKLPQAEAFEKTAKVFREQLQSLTIPSGPAPAGSQVQLLQQEEEHHLREALRHLSDTGAKLSKAEEGAAGDSRKAA